MANFILTRKRGRKRDHPYWILKAHAPEDPPHQTLESYSYSDEEQSLCITVAPETRSKRRTGGWESEPLRGPKKLWVDKDRKDSDVVAATFIDQPDDEAAQPESFVRCSRPKAKAAPDETRDKSRSPRSKNHDSVDVHIYIYICMCVYYIRMYIYIYVHMHLYLRINVYRYTVVYTCAYI